MRFAASRERVKKGLLFGVLVMCTLLHGSGVAGIYAQALKKLWGSIASLLR